MEYYSLVIKCLLRRICLTCSAGFFFPVPPNQYFVVAKSVCRSFCQRLLWIRFRIVSRSAAFIWPGAEVFPTAPKVQELPKISPLSRLIRPVPAMDMVMIGRSA